MDLSIDHRWLLDRQEELLEDKELTVADYSVLVRAVARHRVNTRASGRSR